MNGIEIKKLNFIGSNDRGATWEFMNDRKGTQVLGIRNAGSINGRHYHEGNSLTKDPEIFLLLDGEVEITARNLNSGEQMCQKVQAPAQIVISAMVWHEIKAVSRIVFIELNSIEEHAADTKFRDFDS